MAGDLKSEVRRILSEQPRTAMRRCFMTGKQCIFPHTAEPCAATGNPMVFVVMPFRSNIRTFYEWSLKPFLVEHCGLPESSVQCADEVRDMGYIICEKICRRIQDADLVVGELSLSNANVFYEIGLAYGLRKPVLLFQDRNSKQKALDDPLLRQTLNLPVGNRKVISYPGLSPLKADDEAARRLPEAIIYDLPQTAGERKLRISLLRLLEPSAGIGTELAPDAGVQDIRVEFEEVLSGAVAVAMREIWKVVHTEPKPLSYASAPWAGIVDKTCPEEWKRFSEIEPVLIDGKGRWVDIVANLESSFCTLIDVSKNNPIACFWLGYCHARGLNAIPVYQVRSPRRGNVDTFPIVSSATAEREERLAFDIRALWYAEYDEDHPIEFKAKIREILEHLLERDLPGRQKRIFWDRFPTNKSLRVFTGAIHNENHRREMVGDWDVRTVSELFSYLPSIREARSVELVTPLYSPEEACRKAWRKEKGDNPDPGEPTQEFRRQFLEWFRREIEQDLAKGDAIVIASPETNPLTEYLLHLIYGVENAKRAFDITLSNDPCFNGYVVVKLVAPHPQPATDFPRLFYVEEPSGADKHFMRGFASHVRGLVEKEKFLEPYWSQDDCTREFGLLGHLVVAKRPPKPDARNHVILLNGVSGPATFALAEILTGAATRSDPSKNSESESILARINNCLDQPGCIGVEAIIRVKIVPGKPRGEETSYPTDNRQVASWSIHKDGAGNELLRKIEAR